jgi:DNA repair protein RecO (recombination protein O)
MIIRTDAVVLRSLDYGETSQIVTLFTRLKGKVAVLAKGARLPKSRFGSSLQPMSYAQVVFYYKPTRSLQNLSESSHVQPFHRVSRDLEKIGIGLRIVELVYALMQEEEQNPLVFNLVLQVLQALDAAETRAANLLPYFQLRLAAALGFAPVVDREVLQALPAQGGVLQLDSGVVVPHDTPTASGRPSSRAALRAFAVFARADLDAVMRMRLTPPLSREVAHLVEDYLRYHVEDAYPSRSLPVLEQLFPSPHTPKGPPASS